jgi:hypothetical protein
VQRSGSDAALRRSGGSWKRHWRQVRRWRVWSAAMGSTRIRCLARGRSMLPGDLGSRSQESNCCQRGSTRVSRRRLHEPALTGVAQAQRGTIPIELRKAQVHIEGSADPALVARRSSSDAYLYVGFILLRKQNANASPSLILVFNEFLGSSALLQFVPKSMHFRTCGRRMLRNIMKRDNPPSADKG